MSKEQKITTDIKVPNKDLEALRLNFPHCFDKDGNFQLEKFKNNLTEKEINFSNESYGLDWLGKSYARLLASDPATTLLKADEIHNSKPENANSENLLIKGDNLEVLKHLTNAYYEQVKMIYIDPPYNTGDDGFIYEDERKFTPAEIKQLIGVDDEKAKRILDFTNQKSNSHSAWLTFIYPRLYIAKQLLKDEGVIFVSIDENEAAQLRLLMDEVFGEENFIGDITRVAKTGGAKGTFFTPNIDFIFVYGKIKRHVSPFRSQITAVQIKTFYNKKQTGGDRDGEMYGEERIFKSSLDARPNQRYWIKCPDGSFCIPTGNTKPSELKEGEKVTPNSDDGVWKWTYDTYNDEFNKGNIIFKKTKTSPLINENGIQSKYNLYNKLWLKDQQEKGKVPANFMLEFENRQSSKELAQLNIPFDFAKPVRLIKHLIEIAGLEENDIVMDFFAGSGTTGDAVMQLNAEDGGKRKFILVQLPEEIDPKKNKAAYEFVKDELKAEPTIFEITKERLLRAAKKIKNENTSQPSRTEKLKCDGIHEEHCPACKGEYSVKLEAKESKDLSNVDLGFKIFETTSIWEDYDFESIELDHQTKLFDESKLTEDDIKALLITWKTYDGIALTQELEKIDLSGYTAYYGNGKLYLMDKGFTTDNLKNLLEKIDSDKKFSPTSIITFGYHFESKNLRELSENVKSYANKKNIDIDFITRY
jgi:adenine-specific DNA-methyltransferase